MFEFQIAKNTKNCGSFTVSHWLFFYLKQVVNVHLTPSYRRQRETWNISQNKKSLLLRLICENNCITMILFCIRHSPFILGITNPCSQQKCFVCFLYSAPKSIYFIMFFLFYVFILYYYVLFNLYNILYASGLNL